MKEQYDEDYYERGIELNISGYSNYRWIPELTIPLAFRLIEYLNIKQNMTILDYGCAKGYLVKALRLLHRNAFGYDISEYALANSPQEVKEFLFTRANMQHFDWVISKDVLEHVPYESIEQVLDNIYNLGDNFFIIVPLGKDGKYEIPSYNLDITHIITEPMEWWADLFSSRGFYIKNKSFKVANIKENYAHYDKGNGFFTLSK